LHLFIIFISRKLANTSGNFCLVPTHICSQTVPALQAYVLVVKLSVFFFQLPQTTGAC